MANLPDDESCAPCRYYINDVSECRRNPPSVWLPTSDYMKPSAGLNKRVFVTWPTVKPDDWCGQFLKVKNQPIPPIAGAQ